MRYTQKYAQSRFRKVAEVFGKPVGYKFGYWHFDYQLSLGGGVIVEITEDGDCRRIFTQHRLKLREFCIMCDAILEAIEMWQSRRNKAESQ